MVPQIRIQVRQGMRRPNEHITYNFILLNHTTMKNATITQSEVIDLLTGYSSNGVSSSDIAERLGLDNDLRVAEILGQFQREWDSAPCDDEGATEEQDEYLDNILESAADKLLAL